MLYKHKFPILQNYSAHFKLQPEGDPACIWCSASGVWAWGQSHDLVEIL